MEEPPPEGVHEPAMEEPPPPGEEPAPTDIAAQVGNNLERALVIYNLNYHSCQRVIYYVT
jgi:hypothetical protein